MILNNYWEAFRLFIIERDVDGIQNQYTNHNLVNLAGVSQLPINHYTWGYNQYYTPNANQNSDLRKTEFEMLVGTGTTPVTPNDYRLANDITSNLSNTSLQSTSLIGDAGIKTVYSFTGTNNTTSNITISEIGLVKKFLNSDTSNGNKYLLVREVLDNPITVTAGTGFILTFEWNEG